MPLSLTAPYGDLVPISGHAYRDEFHEKLRRHQRDTWLEDKRKAIHMIDLPNDLQNWARIDRPAYLAGMVIMLAGPYTGCIGKWSHVKAWGQPFYVPDQMVIVIADNDKALVGTTVRIEFDDFEWYQDYLERLGRHARDRLLKKVIDDHQERGFKRGVRAHATAVYKRMRKEAGKEGKEGKEGEESDNEGEEFDFSVAGPEPAIVWNEETREWVCP